jgi:hypothetical protein
MEVVARLGSLHCLRPPGMSDWFLTDRLDLLSIAAALTS